MEILTDRIQGLIKWLGNHPAAIFILWAMWLSAEYFSFGNASYVSIWDNGDSILPALIASASDISKGLFPYWNALAAAGTDRLSMGFTDIEVMLFTFIPGWLSYGFIMWLQRFVAGYFTFRLLRDFLHVEFLPALLAGMIYSFFSQECLNHSWAGFKLYDRFALPGLPFLLWIFSRMDPSTNKYSYLYAAILGILLSLNSHYSFMIFIFPLILFWFLLIIPRRTSSFWTMLGAFVVAWVLCETPDLWSSIMNGPLSHRARWMVDSILTEHWSTPWLESVALAKAYMRDNILSISLALMGLILSVQKDKRLYFMMGAIIFCLIFIFFYHLLMGILISHLGWLSGFRFWRIIINVPFLCAVSGALGLSMINAGYRLALFNHNTVRKQIPLKTFIGVICIVILVAQSVLAKERIYREMAAGANYANLYQNKSLRLLSGMKQSIMPFRVATVADILDYEDRRDPSCAWSYGLETADGYVLMHTQRYHEYWMQVISPMSKTNHDFYNWFKKGGTRMALFSSRDDYICKDSLNFRDYYNVDLLSLVNTKYITSPVPLVDEDLILLSDTPRDAMSSWRRKPLRDKFLDLILGNYSGPPLYIYENKKALPRFMLVRKVKRFEYETQILSELGRAKVEDLASTAYLKHSDVKDMPYDLGAGSIGSVVVKNYSSDLIILNVRTSSKCILITTNNYNPYWKALINGAETRIFPVDHTFQGIYLDKGNYEIILKYEPPYAKELIVNKVKKHINKSLFGSKGLLS